MPPAMEDSEWEVRVVVRCRPLLSQERVADGRRCIIADTRRAQISVGTSLQRSIRCWDYDDVLDEACPQQECYERTVQQLVPGLFEGYNVTIFAYGQTGSGKTHTVFGVGGDDAQLDGITTRLTDDLFRLAADAEDSGSTVSIRLSFIEIYKEEIRDLLVEGGENKSAKVVLRDAPRGGGTVLVNACVAHVSSADEVLSLLCEGARHRTTGGTRMNAHSSRSHAIATFVVERKRVDEDGVPTTTCAKFHLVDLAGTERAARTGATGIRFKESIKINQGLFTLGRVIRALSTSSLEDGGRRKAAPHVPYRESKLTRFLQDSLGGNSRTVMIACVSPADANIQETIDTLQYASRARTITNAPIVNTEVPPPPSPPSPVAPENGNIDLACSIANLACSVELALTGRKSVAFSPRDASSNSPRSRNNINDVDRVTAPLMKRLARGARRSRRLRKSLCAARAALRWAANDMCAQPDTRAIILAALQGEGNDATALEDSLGPCGSSDSEVSNPEEDTPIESQPFIGALQNLREQVISLQAQLQLERESQHATTIRPSHKSRDSIDSGTESDTENSTQHTLRTSHSTNASIVKSSRNNSVRGSRDSHTSKNDRPSGSTGGSCTGDEREGEALEEEALQIEQEAADLEAALALELEAASEIAFERKKRKRDAENRMYNAGNTAKKLAASAQEAAQLVKRYTDRVSQLKAAKAEISSQLQSTARIVEQAERFGREEEALGARLTYTRTASHLRAITLELAQLTDQSKEHDDIKTMRRTIENRIRDLAAQRQVAANDLRRIELEEASEAQSGSVAQATQRIRQLREKAKELRRTAALSKSRMFKDGGIYGAEWLNSAVESHMEMLKCEHMLRKEGGECSSLESKLQQLERKINNDRNQSSDSDSDAIETLEATLAVRRSRFAELKKRRKACEGSAPVILQLPGAHCRRLLQLSCEELANTRLAHEQCLTDLATAAENTEEWKSAALEARESLACERAISASMAGEAAAAKAEAQEAKREFANLREFLKSKAAGDQRVVRISSRALREIPPPLPSS